MEQNNESIRKKILIIDNGGTVSMKRSGGVLKPVDGREDIRRLIYRITRPVELYYTRVGKIDSANMYPPLMKKIFDTVVKNYGDYDGFVVLSGTDTLAYLSSFLSFWLIEIHKPVVITGSQKPLNELGSDAPGNIYYSIMFACEDIPEVTVFFGKHLFRGNRVTKVDSQGFDAFDSPNFLPLGHVDALHHRIHSPLESLLRPVEKEDFQYAWNDRVAVIIIYPGMNPELLQSILSHNYRGIVIEAFGMGNMPFEGPFSLEGIVEKLINSGVIVCVRSSCLKGGVHVEYETAKKFADMGAIYLRDITRESAYAKLSWLTGKTDDTEMIKSEMMRSISGEMLPVEQEDVWKISH